MTYNETILQKAQPWLAPPFDEETQAKVKAMMETNPDAFNEAFYTDLEFGTGGLRGVMGVGTNRLNKYTVGLATQGFANYLNRAFPHQTPSVAIAYDSRNSSPEFSENAADVLTANGIRVYLFDALRPTPLLSFAVRHLNCQGGIVVTASHNPPAYNGYKAYWEDGGQIVAPHDSGIIGEVRKIESYDQVKTTAKPELLSFIGSEIDDAYIEELKKKALSPEAVQKQQDLPIVFTSLHGTGSTMIPRVLREIGFKNIHEVAEQAVPDGDFPTVESPNPEEGAALQMGINLAKEIDAAIVLGTDPDADRVGIAVRDHEGNYQLLNGNDTGALLVWYQLTRMKASGSIPSNGFIGKTIVTSELIADIATFFGLPCYNTLTGFKFIADLIRKKEGKEVFITGGEESYGYMIGDFVRDKDAVAASMVIAEMTAWAKNEGMNLLDLLKEIHLSLSVYREALVSLKKEGKSGKEEIAAMMEGFRTKTPETLAGKRVVRLLDYHSSEAKNLVDQTVSKINQPSSNVIQLVLEDGAIVTARPSGTEPKIKFYFSVKDDNSNGDYFDRRRKLEDQIERLKKEFLGASK